MSSVNVSLLVLSSISRVFPFSSCVSCYLSVSVPCFLSVSCFLLCVDLLLVYCLQPPTLIIVLSSSSAIFLVLLSLLLHGLPLCSCLSHILCFSRLVFIPVSIYNSVPSHPEAHSSVVGFWIFASSDSRLNSRLKAP